MHGFMNIKDTNWKIRVQGRENCYMSFPKRPDWLWGPPSLLISGSPGFFLWEQALEVVKFDHSLPYRPEVKNEWMYTSTLPYKLMARTGTNKLLKSLGIFTKYVVTSYDCPSLEVTHRNIRCSVPDKTPCIAHYAVENFLSKDNAGQRSVCREQGSGVWGDGYGLRSKGPHTVSVKLSDFTV